MLRPRACFLLCLVVLAAASRVLPHPPNFAPIAAVALFGSATFAGRRSAVLVPFGSLLLGDVLLHAGFLAGWQPMPGFYGGQWVVYACLLPAIALGFAIRGRRTVATVAAATLANAVVFFLTTNFACFYGAGSPYPRTIPGLILCYELALPFFRNSLAGDAFFATALFGGLALAEAKFPAIRGRSTAAEIAA